jgi:putative two-component system response regulator
MQERYKVLVVDDEPFNLELIQAVFSEYDTITIDATRSGEEALEKITTTPYDTILLDISMPKMDGLEVLHHIKNDENTKDIPVLMLTANIEKEMEALKLGANDFITKPCNVDILCARTFNYAQLGRQTHTIKQHNKNLEKVVQQRTLSLQKALDLAKNTEYEISVRLGRASEFRDIETGGHIKRMSRYSELLARLYGLSDEECELILYAAPLHDIGKVGIPDKVLLKPGRFTPDEFEVMKKHSLIGAAMLEGSQELPILNAGHIIALQHHEKWDGTGYPHGKKGEEIHLYARIVSIADVFDALNSKRCYKDSIPIEKVIEIIKAGASSHFDPELVEVFLQNVEQFITIAQQSEVDHSLDETMNLIEQVR